MNDYGQKKLNELKESSAAEEPVGAELWRIWSVEIKPHFTAEEEFLLKYGDEAGYDQKYIARVLSDHRVMETLVWKNGDEGVRDFAKVLAAHIRYREDYFTLRLSRILESEKTASPAGNQ